MRCGRRYKIFAGLPTVPGARSRSSPRLLRGSRFDHAIRCNATIPIARMKIRVAIDADRDAIWKIFHEIVAAGDTYALDPNVSRKEALQYWFGKNTRAYVAESGGRVAGTYILRPNQSGGGTHVANAAFMVAHDVQGQGIGRAMGEHCLSEARRLGFRAMQFNFVVSTNESAAHLWQKLGFKIIGTLPGAFRHPEKDYIDVYVMYRSLLEDQA